jgi:predicted ATP-dependent serine protease
MSTRIVKCPNCGVFNTNREYCENCGELISDQKKREIKEEALKQDQIKEAIYEIENPNLAARLKKSPNAFKRIAGWVLYSVITVVSAIGAGLAWIIAMVAAG